MTHDHEEVHFITRNLFSNTFSFKTDSYKLWWKELQSCRKFPGRRKVPNNFHVKLSCHTWKPKTQWGTDPYKTNRHGKSGKIFIDVINHVNDVRVISALTEKIILKEKITSTKC